MSAGLLPPAAATQSYGTSGKHGCKCFLARQIARQTLTEEAMVLRAGHVLLRAGHKARIFCRQVKLADSSVQSYGGLTTCTDYHLIKKDESIVDSVFMHDKYASPGAAGDESAMVVFTGTVQSPVMCFDDVFRSRQARMSTGLCAACRTSRLVVG